MINLCQIVGDKKIGTKTKLVDAMKLVALNERFAMKTVVDYLASNDTYKGKPVRKEMKKSKLLYSLYCNFTKVSLANPII